MLRLMLDTHPQLAIPPETHFIPRLAKLGGSIPAKAERNPAAFDRFVRSEVARWAPVLAATRTEK